MKPSALHLEGYYIKELAISLNEGFAKTKPFGSWTGYHYQPDKDFKADPAEFEVYRELGTKMGDPKSVRYVLKVRSSGSRNKCPYAFKIALVGYFHIDEKLKISTEASDAAVSSTAPAILYSAARELLALNTARGPYPSIILPPISFEDDPSEIGSKGSAPKRRVAKRGTRKANK